jgi:hypothetical protein
MQQAMRWKAKLDKTLDFLLVSLLGLFVLALSGCERCAPQNTSGVLMGIEFRDSKSKALLGLDSVLAGVRATEAEKFIWFADTVKQVLYLPLNPKTDSSIFEIFLINPFKNQTLAARYNVKIINNPPNCSFFEQIGGISLKISQADSVAVLLPSLDETPQTNAQIFLSLD